MSTAAKENLDERIERIKKRNEEIEKKYREAEEDRLRALKNNAMVEMKPPRDDDWPRTHKYDKIDLYEVDTNLEESSKNMQPPNDNSSLSKRDYKKFPEGEGPPPDPAYNFLADAERDGLSAPIAEKSNTNKDREQKAYQHSQTTHKNNREQLHKQSSGDRARGGKVHNPKYQKSNSQPDYEQWRTEREKIDEARINRQKVGEGKWCREWDNEKHNSENEAMLKSDQAETKKNNSHHVDMRGITVSVSKTGEVKSVKLTSAPIIGSGRVGPRQITKPQFSIQPLEKDENIGKLVPQSSKLHPKKQNTSPNLTYYQTNKIVTNSDVISNSHVHQQIKNGKVANQSRKPKLSKFALDEKAEVPISLKESNDGSFSPATLHTLKSDLPIESANELIVADLLRKPEFAKKSVQDRLIRIRQEVVSNETNITISQSATSEDKNASTFIFSLAQEKSSKPIVMIKSDSFNCDLISASNQRTIVDDEADLEKK